MTDSLRAALDIIAASPSKDAPDAIGVSARNIARAALAADTARPGLEEAWAEAEAVLPEGWERVSLTIHRHFPADGRWVADVADDWPRLERPIRTYGATPADALRALAARLTED